MTELVERERELAQLDALVDAAPPARAAWSLIEGPAGIGKSAAARRGAPPRAPTRGALVLAARGSELEREFPFGVVRQLFEAALADPDARARCAGAAAPARAGLRRAASGARPRRVLRRPARPLLARAQPRRASGPLLLAVDDLHWCDRPSLRFLAYLARRLEGSRSCVAADPAHAASPAPTPALLGEIAHDPADRLDPARPAERRRRARARARAARAPTPTTAFAAACHDATGGNPLLLRQLLTALEADGVRPDAAHAGLVREIGPRAVSRTVLLRLARLPPDAIAVARAVAVLGEGADLPAVAALAGLDEARVARRHRRARAGGDPAARAAARLRPPAGARRRLPRAAARRARAAARARRAVLRDAGAPAEQVAAQLLATPRRGERWVGRRCCATPARAAVARGAPDSAVAYLRRALDEPPPPSAAPALLLELGLAEALTDGPGGRRAPARGLRDARRPARAGARWRTLLGRALLFTGDAEEARRGRAPARAASCRTSWTTSAAAARGVELIVALLRRGDARRPRGARRPLRAAAAGRRPGAEAARGAGRRCGCAYAAAGRGVRRARPARAARAALLRAATTGCSSSRRSHARRSPTATRPTRSLDGGARRRAPPRLAVRRSRRCTCGTASRCSGAASSPRPRSSLRHRAGGVRRLGLRRPRRRVHARFLAARPARARATRRAPARRSSARRRRPAPRLRRRRFWRARGLELLLAEGRARRRVAAAERVRATATPVRTTRPRRPGARCAAGRSTGSAGATRRSRCCEEELAVARALRRAGRGRPRAARARRAARRRRARRLREAVEVLEGSPRAARARQGAGRPRRGAAPRRAGRPTRASRCGARSSWPTRAAPTALAEHVRAELHATGARPRTTPLGGVESLTASERRVAGLAAEGQTNRDIAQALFVTPEDRRGAPLERLPQARHPLAARAGRGARRGLKLWGGCLGVSPMARGGMAPCCAHDLTSGHNHPGAAPGGRRAGRAREGRPRRAAVQRVARNARRDRRDAGGRARERGRSSRLARASQ